MRTDEVREHGSPLVVCCGLATLDLRQEVQRVPGPDEKVVATALDVSSGGPAANAAATAAALGTRARLVTAVGSGLLADVVTQDLARAGVEVVDLLAGTEAVPPVSTVLVTRATGERAVVSVNATATAGVPVPDAAELDDLLDGAAVLLVDGHHLEVAVALAAGARRRGVPVVLDGGSWKPGLERLLRHVDHALLSADFRVGVGSGADLGAAPDDDLTAVAVHGVGVVARTAGPGPVRWWTATDGLGAPVHPPAVAPAEVVDTLGAGDVLHGAYATRLALGDDVPAALGAAVEVASRSVRARGARGWATG